MTLARPALAGVFTVAVWLAPHAALAANIGQCYGQTMLSEARSGDRATTARLTCSRSASDSLVKSLLEAGGSGAAEVDRGALQYRAIVARLRSTPPLAGDARQRARAVHRFVHQEILRGKYEAAAGDLAAVLEDGEPHNCATTSALFVALAAEVGLNCSAIAVPGHVWCRVTAQSEAFDVETTCRDWFELVGEEGSQAGHAATSILAEHRRRAALGRVLDKAGLLAVFHYNRGVRLFREQCYRAAAEANLAALALDPKCQGAFDNLLAAVNDWSLKLAEHGHRPEALKLLDEAITIAPNYGPFRHNRRFLSAAHAATMTARDAE